MKKKYFFGIFICLVLLCSGVFLLSPIGFGTFNDITINNPSDAETVNIKCTYKRAYGYGGKLGATIKMEHMLSEADGSGHDQEKKSYTLSSTTSLPYTATTYHNNMPLRRGRKVWVLSVTYPEGLSNGRITINAKKFNLAAGNTVTYDVGFWTQNNPGVFTVYLYYNAFLTLNYNGGYSYNGTNSSIIYDTYDQRMELSDGTKKSTLALPKRDGYTFSGYYTAKKDGTQVIGKDGKWTDNWGLGSVKPTTLYAHWTANKYTVTLNKNGGSGGSSTVTATYNSTMPSITPPSKEGYQFLGYWDKTSGGTQYYNANGKSARNWNKASNATLYARWERNNYKIDINFYKPNGSTQQGGTFDLYKQLSGGSETLVKSGISNEVSGQESLQYEGKFILKEITPLTGTTISSVSLSNDNGTLSTSGNPINTITYTASQTGPPSGSWDNAILIYTSLNSLKATLNYQGKGTGSTTATAEYNTNGTKLNLPSSLTHTGYTFKGWSLTPNGTGEYNANTNWNNITINNTTVSTPNAGEISFNLYAIWQANKYTINLNLQGGSGVKSPIKATYDKVINIPNPTKTGYIFTGWSATSGLDTNTAKSGTSNSLTALTKWTGAATKNTYFANLTAAVNGAVTLTANWTAITYTIAFNSNGGSGNMQNQSFTYDSEKALSTNTFKRAGYIFKEWNTEKNGTGTRYSDKAKVRNLASKQGTKITLYAQWEETIASNIKSTFATAGTYYISTAEDLAKLIYTTEIKSIGNGYFFIQTADIDLSGLTYLPIGRLNSFSGTYDGQGNIISGITTYNGEDANNDYLETNGGLFANASGAKIKNVIIEKATIYGQNAGIIAGSGNSSTSISGCIVSGKIYGSSVGRAIIGNANGGTVSVCLARGVNIGKGVKSVFASNTNNIDSCIYELTDGTRGKSSTFNKYSEWIYPSNFAYPMPKVFMWYPYPELSEDSLNDWIG